MKATLIHEADRQRTFAVVLDKGDEAISCLKTFIAEEAIGAAQLTAIGAFESACLGYFDWDTKSYSHNPVKGQVEVASFIGDVALTPDDKPSLHVHCVLGHADGRAVAGHLLEGNVRPTLEVIVTESPVHLRKRKDPESGLALIDPAASHAVTDA